MPAKTSTPNRPDDGFDVVCVVGRVTFDSTGDVPPHIAAMILIAEHNAPGTYEFPTVDGGTCHVAVGFSDPDGGMRIR